MNADKVKDCNSLSLVLNFDNMVQGPNTIAATPAT